MTNKLGPEVPSSSLPGVRKNKERIQRPGVIPSFPRFWEKKGPGKFKGIHRENLVNEFGTPRALAPKG
jgi:hypothetical protein